MRELRAFLDSLGLSKYADVFERNEIELVDLETLTDTNLRELGIEAMGPRNRLLAAIAARRAGGVTSSGDRLSSAGTFVAPSAGGGASVRPTGDALASSGTAFVAPAPSVRSSVFRVPPPGGRVGSVGASATSSVLRTGTKLGKYTVLKELGRGSMGVVYRAYDELTELDVALKVIHPDRLEAPGAVRQLAQEVSKGLQVTHGNLLRVHGFEVGPPAYVVMEYVDGETLTQRWTARLKRLPFGELRPILIEVLKGLQCLHERRLAHRDVKPDNVMLTKDGQVKITDFGVSASLGEQLSGVAGSAGTLRYMAPEALRGEVCDARSDVYAVGMMAYQLLSGGFPFAEHDVNAIRAWHLGAGRALSAVEGLEVISRALCARAEDRWASAGAMAAALEGLESTRRAKAEGAAAEGAANAKAEPAWRQSWMTACGQDSRSAWAEARVGAAVFRFRWCPPGRFHMGSPSSEAGRWNDEVQHEVELTRGFWLGETPVTQRQWEAVMGANPSRFVDADRPVEQVGWDDCATFLGRANGQVPGLNVRLPTEAEWEYACRAGTKTATWAGDLVILGENNAPVLDAIAWYGGNSGVGYDHGTAADSNGWKEKQHAHTRAGTRRVAQKSANPWGLYDMLGNVWEWCSDWCEGYPTTCVVDPTGPATGTKRVFRGGSWSIDAQRVRAAVRRAYAPDTRDSVLGFRLARGQ